MTGPGGRGARSLCEPADPRDEVARGFPCDGWPTVDEGAPPEQACGHGQADGRDDVATIGRMQLIVRERLICAWPRLPWISRRILLAIPRGNAVPGGAHRLCTVRSGCVFAIVFVLSLHVGQMELRSSHGRGVSVSESG
jgi:hypothetical protein